jgi:hypothetical protein
MFPVLSLSRSRLGASETAMHDGLAQQFQQLALLERAARSAIGCWLTTEQRLCNGVQGAESPNQIFPNGWFRYWGVVRTFRKGGDRQGIRQLLFDAKPKLVAPQPNASELVQGLSEKIRPMNCVWQPTSLVSKFSFSCSPTTFVPYDSIVRGQLRTREHDYLAYARAFAERQAVVEQQLREFIRPDGQVGLAAKNLPLNGNVMDQQIFLARTTDWYFLLQGGYDPIKQGNPVHHGPMI